MRELRRGAAEEVQRAEILPRDSIIDTTDVSSGHQNYNPELPAAAYQSVAGRGLLGGEFLRINALARRGFWGHSPHLYDLSTHTRPGTQPDAAGSPGVHRGRIIPLQGWSP